MALNNLGMGFLFTATDLASPAMGNLSRNFKSLTAGTDVGAKAITASLKTIGVGFAGLAAGASGLLVLNAATNEAANFGRSIAEVSTLIDEATFSTDAMRKATKGAAAEFGGDAAGQASALYQIISAGAGNARDATELLTQSNKLAVGGITEVATAADVLTSAVNVYSTSGLTAADATDSLFVAIKAGKTTAGELARSLGVILPTANSLRIGFDEVNAAIAAMTANGLATSRAVTGLNAAFANIKKPTKDASDEARRLGIEFDESSLRAQGLQGFLQSIVGSSKFTDESFTKLFGSIEAGNAVVSLTSNGMEKFNQTLDAMNKKTGAANAAFEKMSDTLAFQQDRFDSISNTMLISIGEVFEPLKKSVLEVVNAFLEGFNALSPSTRSFLVQAFAIASVVATIGGAFLVLQGAAGLLGLTFGGIATAIGGAVLAALPFIAIFGAIVAAIKLVQAVFEADLGGIATFFKTQVLQPVRLVWDALKQLFTQGGFSGAVREELNRAENQGIKQFAIKAFVIFNRVKAFFEGFMQGFGKAIDAGAPAFKRLVAAFASIAAAFGFAFSGDNDPKKNADAFAIFANVGETLGAIIGDLAVIFADTLVPAFLAVAGVVAVLREIFVFAFGLIGDAISFIGDIIFSLFVLPIKGAMAIVAGILSGDFETVMTGMKIIAFGVINAIISIFFFLAKTIARVVEGIGSLFGADLNIVEGMEQVQKDVQASVAKGLQVSAGDVGIEVPPLKVTPIDAGTVGVTPPKVTPVAATATATVPTTLVPAPQAATEARSRAFTPAPEASELLKPENFDLLAAKIAEANAARPIVLELDGETVAESTARSRENAAALSFSPVPT